MGSYVSSFDLEPQGDKKGTRLSYARATNIHTYNIIMSVHKGNPNLTHIKIKSSKSMNIWETKAESRLYVQKKSSLDNIFLKIIGMGEEEYPLLCNYPKCKLSSNVVYCLIRIDRIDLLTNYANKFYKRFRHDIETISMNVPDYQTRK